MKKTKGKPGKMCETSDYLTTKQGRCCIAVGRRSRRTFSTDFEIFRRRDLFFFNSDFKFVDNASESSVTSLYVVFIFSSKFTLIFLQAVLYRD